MPVDEAGGKVCGRMGGVRQEASAVWSSRFAAQRIFGCSACGRAGCAGAGCVWYLLLGADACGSFNMCTALPSWGGW